MSECSDLTYYQNNRDVIINRSKVYYENAKERLREQVRDKYRKLSEEKKKERVWKKNIAICLKKTNKDYKNIKNIIVRLKSLNITMNKIVF